MDPGAPAQIKTSALEVAAAATVETAGDAARHVIAALGHYADDPDLRQALTDLEQLAPEAVAEAQTEHNAELQAEPPPAETPPPTLVEAPPATSSAPPDVSPPLEAVPPPGASSSAPPPEDAPPAETPPEPEQNDDEARAAASAPGPEPEPAPEPEAPVAVSVPPHAPETGGWPNDWATYRLNSRVRAKQLDAPFLTEDGQQGAAGDYYVIYLDAHGEPRATSPFAVMSADSFHAVFELA